MPRQYVVSLVEKLIEWKPMNVMELKRTQLLEEQLSNEELVAYYSKITEKIDELVLELDRVSCEIALDLSA